VLSTVVGESPGADGVPEVRLSSVSGRINADLTIGADVKSARPLRANERLASPGVKLHGSGFIVSPSTARALGLGKSSGLERHIRPYLNGRDLLQRSRGEMVIDLFGLGESEARERFPSVYQHILTHVKPERDLNNRASYSRFWWIFGEPRQEMRPALSGLVRFIVTPVTAKHRIFAFVSGSILPDDALIAFAFDDAYVLGVLSSRTHAIWAAAAGGTLEDRPRYLKATCFDPFPFPAATAGQRAEIAAIGKELEALRKARLAAHPHLTLTGLYNVLAALRAGGPLTPAERDLHDAGHVSILRMLHDRLDAAVAAAYGWPADLPDAEIVARVVALNAERVTEEAAGTVRWLRPEFQALEAAPATRVQAEMDVGAEAPLAAAPAWPKDMVSQFTALRSAIAAGPAAPADIARRFKGAPRGAKLDDMLSLLVALGQARQTEGGRFTA